MTDDKPIPTVALVADARRMARSGEARALRVAADLTLEEIASAVGVSRQALAGWEKGERRPGGNNARHYAAVLQELRDRAAKACTAR